MAKMYPPRFTRSEDRMRNAEKRFYDACRDQLGDDWTVMYEVSWFGRRNQGNERGDADFLLMHPQMGIFCVELKGGQEIFIKGNEWFTIPHGKTEPVKIRDPFGQAADSKSVLWEYIRKIAPDIKLSGAFGHFVVFPGAEISGDLSPSARRSLICDKNDMRNLLATITRISNYLGQRLKLTEENIDKIRETVWRDAVLVSQTQNSLNQAVDTLEQLTEQQLAAFEMMRNLKEFVVTGGAGTGKTVLAFNRACTLASQGARTLFLCHSKAAARHLRGLADPNLDEILDIFSLDEFISGVMESADWKKTIFEDGDIDNISNDFLNKALENQLFFDALIVDEAQNIPKNFVELLTTILPNVGTRYIYVFGDSRQNTLQVKRSALTLFSSVQPFPLDINCRSSNEIAIAACAIFNEKTNSFGSSGPKPIFAQDLIGQSLGSYEFSMTESSIGVARAAKHLIEVFGLKAENVRNVVAAQSGLGAGVMNWTNSYGLLINPNSWEIEYLLDERYKDEPQYGERFERQLKLIGSGFHAIKSIALPDIQGLESDGVIFQIFSLTAGLNVRKGQRDTDLVREAKLWEEEIRQALERSVDGRLNLGFIDESNMTVNRRILFEHFKTVVYTAITRARYAVVFLGSNPPLALMRIMLADNVDVLRFESNESGPAFSKSSDCERIVEIHRQLKELFTTRPKTAESKQQLMNHALFIELSELIHPYQNGYSGF